MSSREEAASWQVLLCCVAQRGCFLMAPDILDAFGIRAADLSALNMATRTTFLSTSKHFLGPQTWACFWRLAVVAR